MLIFCRRHLLIFAVELRPHADGDDARSLPPQPAAPRRRRRRAAAAGAAPKRPEPDATPY